MADRMEANGSQPLGVTDSTWSQLLAETVDEVARIVRTEIGLAEASLSRLLERKTERAYGVVLLLVALVYGLMFVLSSAVLLIHQWLAWWMAFGIAGVVVIAVVFASQTIMAWHATSRSS